MRKLITFFSVLAFFSLIFLGCQSNEDITTPVTSGLDKTVSITPVNVIPGEQTCVELVACQHIVIGNVCIETVGLNLKVTYNITNNDWSITETHLAIVGDPNDFPRTSNGNPKVGNFPFKGTHDNVSSVEYLVPIDNLPSLVYVAAHAAVANCDLVVSATGLCTSFPENSNMTPTWLPSDALNYTVKTTFDFGTYYGFCVDNSRYISNGSTRTVNFICSYDDMPVCTPPQFFVEKPENLDLVNWIINNRQSNWDRKVIQAAIWELMNPSGTLTDWQNSTLTTGTWKHDPVLREEIVALAQTNDGFVPSCDQKVLALVYGPGEICNPIKQVVVFEVPVECVQQECINESAWAFQYDNGPIPNQSALFGRQWARYYSYLR